MSQLTLAFIGKAIVPTTIPSRARNKGELRMPPATGLLRFRRSFILFAPDPDESEAGRRCEGGGLSATCTTLPSRSAGTFI